MSEIKNKLVYLDVYSTSSSGTPSIMDNAVSVLHNIQDCFSGFETISTVFWQNSTEPDSLDTATLSIEKNGYDSWYMITATTSGRTDAKCVFKVELICKNGKTISLYSNAYEAKIWSSSLFRIYYFSTSKIFLFAIDISSSATPPTAFHSPTITTLCYTKDKNDISFYFYGMRIYKDDGTYKLLSMPGVSNIDVDKVTLANIYVNSYALDGLYMLTTSSSSLVNCNYYCELKGYGRYYACYIISDSHQALAIKLDEE